LGLSLQSIRAAALHYIEAAKGPTIGCQPAGAYCQWCHVATKVAAVVVGAVVPMFRFVSRGLDNPEQGKVKTKVSNVEVNRTGHVSKHTEN
jgi:hypothetical protein